MRKFIFIAIGAIVLLASLCVAGEKIQASSLAEASFSVASEGEVLPEDSFFYTVMSARGHVFGGGGDINKWAGWYFDTIYLEDGNMLKWDSVGPSTLRLSLVTRDLSVDLGDSEAASKIRAFFKPIKGFKRFRKTYEECLDLIVSENYGVFKYMGNVYFSADYADSTDGNADKINRFVGTLAGAPDAWMAHPDIPALSDYIARETVDKWILDGVSGFGSNVWMLDICAHVATPGFVTFSKYENERICPGHGDYTETFHTLDLKSGKEFKNNDIFKPNTLDDVKRLLYEVISKDPYFLEWNEEANTPEAVEEQFKLWESTMSTIDDEDEQSEPRIGLQLPEGALTATGVVFSFQPYEISCFAAGAFHFIIPYDRLVPYLTPAVRALTAPFSLQ